MHVQASYARLQNPPGAGNRRFCTWLVCPARRRGQPDPSQFHRRQAVSLQRRGLFEELFERRQITGGRFGNNSGRAALLTCHSQLCRREQRARLERLTAGSRKRSQHGSVNTRHTRTRGGGAGAGADAASGAAAHALRRGARARTGAGTIAVARGHRRAGPLERRAHVSHRGAAAAAAREPDIFLLFSSVADEERLLVPNARSF